MSKRLCIIALTLIFSIILCAQDEASNTDNSLKDLLVRAKSGETVAQFELGYKYYKGIDFQQDYLEAVYWLRLAVEQDYADAQAVLGQMYKNGEGVTQDYKEALFLLRKAADQNNPRAQFNLGVMYYAAMGVKANDKTAAKYFRQASEQGHAEAQENLGTCYFEGTGVPTDYSESYFWYSLAYSNCPPDKTEQFFDNKEKARLEISQSAQDEVNNRLAQWKAEHNTIKN
jgi:TPR repeat protein